MEKQERARKGTLRREICGYIQQQIANGTYRAGDRIVETQLARELNVSQAPVREAILELSAMGLLEERAYSGTYVRKLTAEEVADIYNTRAFLAQYAAERAAKRITEEELARLDTILREMDDAASPREFAEKDMAFHAAIVDAAGSPALKRMWEGLRLVQWTGISIAATGNTLPEIARQHREIYRLLRTGADHTVGAYMFLHIKNFGEEVIRCLRERDSAGDGR